MDPQAASPIGVRLHPVWSFLNQMKRERCVLIFWINWVGRREHQTDFSSGDHGNDSRIRDIWRVLYEFGADKENWTLRQVFGSSWLALMAGSSEDIRRFIVRRDGNGTSPGRRLRSARTSYAQYILCYEMNPVGLQSGEHCGSRFSCLGLLTYEVRCVADLSV